MEIDVLIVGQGVCGTLLAECLLSKGREVMILDDRPHHTSATSFAGGILHAYGKDFKLYDSRKQLLQIAINKYRHFEKKLQTAFISEKKLLLFHDVNGHARSCVNVSNYFHFTEQPFELTAYQLNVEEFLKSSRNFFLAQNCLLEKNFDADLLDVGETISYGNIHARKIIFCDGVSNSGKRWFGDLKFIPNRGDILLLDIEELPEAYLYDRRIRLIHKSGNTWWCGSNQLWDLKNMEPDESWRKEVEEILNSWLKLPFIIKEHVVVQRPTTPGQTPYVTLHQQHKSLGIFNGMGSRGLMYAPFHANAFTQQL